MGLRAMQAGDQGRRCWVATVACAAHRSGIVSEPAPPEARVTVTSLGRVAERFDPSSIQGASNPPGSGSYLSQYERPPHIRELDGLRGIAVLMVMAVHSFAGIRFASLGAFFSF